MLPLAALIPALITGGKALAVGGLGGAASFGVKKGLDALNKKRRWTVSREMSTFWNRFYEKTIDIVSIMFAL